jgi:hypothetical protein
MQPHRIGGLSPLTLKRPSMNLEHGHDHDHDGAQRNAGTAIAAFVIAP